MKQSREVGGPIESDHDPVSRPSHYKGLYPEPLWVLLHWDLSFCRSNAIKYLCRAGRKEDEIQDLQKAAEYIRREIEFLQGKV